METTSINYRELVDSIMENMKKKEIKSVEELSDSAYKLSKRGNINFEPIPDFLDQEPAKRGNMIFELPVEPSIENRLDTLESNQAQMIQMLHQLLGKRVRLLK